MSPIFFFISALLTAGLCCSHSLIHHFPGDVLVSFRPHDSKKKHPDPPVLNSYNILGGGLICFCFFFHPYLRETIQFDDHIFQGGWFNHQLVSHG